MLPAPLKNHQNHLHYNATKRLKILKGAAIYGANGAGKSNLIKSVDFLQWAVLNGSILHNMSLLKFKLDDDIRKNPTVFDVEYEWNRKFYGYHLEIQNDIITEESLYELGIQKEDKMLFERKGDVNTLKITVDLAKKGNISKTKLLEDLLAKNILSNEKLLLSNHKMLNDSKITNAYSWFQNGLLVLFPHTKYSGITKSLSDSEQFSSFVNGIITTLDTGVSQIAVNELSFDEFFGKDVDSKRKYKTQLQKAGDEIPITFMNGNVVVASLKSNGDYVIKKPVTYHKNNDDKNVLFELFEESDGTQRLLDIIPAINLYLNKGTTVLIDEFDESLHPSLLKEIMLKVMESNPVQGGQFIVTTHESNLLDYEIFRQDEIWFVEKHQGATVVYPLTDFKPRSDFQIQKGYLMGRFGAIPFLANLKDLKWQ